jgi:hypothetical protein
MTRIATAGPLLLSALLLVLPALGGCGLATSTYGTGEMPEVAMFREMTGGLLNKNQPKQPIEYQARAPLVMPPAGETAVAQLPPPAESAAAVAPDWPVDREQLKAEADARANDGDPRNDINQGEYNRLKPLSGAFEQRRQQEEVFVSEDEGKSDYYKTIVHSKEQRKQFAKAIADSKGYGSSSERRYLTDPPLTYRAPDTDVPADYVAPETKKGNFLTRWWHKL